MLLTVLHRLQFSTGCLPLLPNPVGTPKKKIPRHRQLGSARPMEKLNA
jgi:hypothetical protein